MENIDLNNLKANPKNPRKISKEQKEMLALSLKKFGDLGGIIFNRASQQLVGGHQRINAMKDGPTPDVTIERKFDTPTRTGTVAEGFIMIDGERFSYREVEWDEQTEKAANIAANQHGGEFDLPQLREWILELDHQNFDLDYIGFTEKELANLMAPVTVLPPSEADEATPSLPREPRTKPGDIYILGKHRLMCGNSTNIQDVESLIIGHEMDIVYTDPPYGINEETDRDFASRTRLAKGNSFHKIMGDDSTETAVAAYSLAQTLAPIVCYWGGNYYADKMPPSPCWIVWDKRVEENQRDMNSDCELAYVKHPSKKSVRIFRHLWKGMIKGSEHGEGRVHPTQKPVALAEWCFEELDKEAKNILDLFGGSGSTLIACQKTGRNCFMMELDPIYCDVIINRFEKYSGEKAYRIDETGSKVPW